MRHVNTMAVQDLKLHWSWTCCHGDGEGIITDSTTKIQLKSTEQN